MSSSNPKDDYIDYKMTESKPIGLFDKNVTIKAFLFYSLAFFILFVTSIYSLFSVILNGQQVVTVSNDNRITELEDIIKNLNTQKLELEKELINIRGELKISKINNKNDLEKLKDLSTELNDRKRELAKLKKLLDPVSVRIGSDVHDDNIYIDGNLVGSTPQTKDFKKNIRYIIKITYKGHEIEKNFSFDRDTEIKAFFITRNKKGDFLVTRKR